MLFAVYGEKMSHSRPTKWLVVLLMLLYLGHHRHSVAVGYQGDGSVSQDDVIRFVLSMRSKEGAASVDRARMRYYQQLPSFTFAEGKNPNDINDGQDVDKTLYGLRIL